MKFFILFLFPFVLYSASKSIILNIDSKFNIPSDFREVIENNLEDYNYNLIEMNSDDVLDIEANNIKITCRKNSCYKELGEKFKADYLLNIEIHKIMDHYSSEYKFKLLLIDLKSLNKIKRLFYYKYKLSNTSQLRVFTENMMIKFFAEIEKIKKMKEIEALNKIPKRLTKKNILDMIRKVYPQIKQCGKDNNYSGIVKIKFKINNDGSVTDIKFITQVTDVVKKCIYDVAINMKTIKFRAQPITINFPLKLD